MAGIPVLNPNAFSPVIFGIDGITPTPFTTRGAQASGLNVAGNDWTIAAPNGTGTGGSGKLIFQTASPGSTGSTPNTLTTRWQLNGKRFESPAPNVGHGTVGLDYGASTFNGTIDPAFCWGYNQNADGTLPLAGENGAAWYIEGDYNDGVKHTIETYFQFTSSNGLVAKRAFFVQTNRSTNLVVGVQIASPLSVLDTDCSTQLFKFDNTALQIFGSSPLLLSTNNVPAVQQENAAGNNVITLFQLNASNQILLGTTVLLGTGGGLLFPSAEATDLGTLSANRPQNINCKTRLNVGTTGTVSTVANFGGTSTTELVAAYFENVGTQTLDQVTSLTIKGSNAASGSGGFVKIAAYVTNATGGTRGTGLAFYVDSQASLGLRTVGLVSHLGNWGLGTSFAAASLPSTLLHVRLADAGTNTVVNAVTIGHNTSGTAAASFGVGQQFQVQTDTTANTNAGRIRSSWATVTHASRKSRMVLSVDDTAEKDVIRLDTDGTYGQFGIVNGLASGQLLQVLSLSELTTIAAAATTDTAITIPAGALVLGVSVRVTVIIPTAATFTVTGTVSATVFNTAAVAVAATTTDQGTAAGCYYNAAAQTVRITPNLQPANNSGRVRVTVFYVLMTPPTS